MTKQREVVDDYPALSGNLKAVLPDAGCGQANKKTLVKTRVVRESPYGFAKIVGTGNAGNMMKRVNLVWELKGDGG
ncbi:MAG TPA: hypothetical protein VF145_04740 [Chitinophagaceae bacterium]